VGTAVGASNASASKYDLQTRYDIAYTQCMWPGVFVGGVFAFGGRHVPG
jgi:hypothetical protein